MKAKKKIFQYEDALDLLMPVEFQLAQDFLDLNREEAAKFEPSELNRQKAEKIIEESEKDLMRLNFSRKG